MIRDTMKEADFLYDLRQREGQALHAAISRGCTQSVRMAAENMRDAIDRRIALLRSHGDAA